MALGRLRRISSDLARRFGKTLGLTVTFAGGLALGVLLHGDLAATRRLGRTIGNAVLASLFEGHIEAGPIRHLSIGRKSSIEIESASVAEPDGRHVIDARGIKASIRIDRLLWSLARGGPPVIAIDAVTVEDATVSLDMEGEPPKLGIVRAFAAKHTGPPKPPKPKSPDEEDVDLSIDGIRIRHGTAKGNLVKPLIDGDVDETRGSLSVHKNVFNITIDSSKATLRSPKAPNQGGPLRGDAKGSLTIPLGTEGMKGHAELVGEVEGLPVTAHASIDDDNVEAAVDIPTSSPAIVERAFPGLGVNKPVEIHATAKGKLPTVILSARANAGEASALVDGEVDLRQGTPFKVDATLTHVDASTFGALSTDISGTIHGEGVLAGATGPTGTFRVATSEGTIEGAKVPKTNIEGRFDDTSVTATFRASEPGVDASGKAVLSVPDKTIAFDVQARSSALRTLARAPNVIDGSASARAVGSIDLTKKTIQARVTGTGESLEQGPLHAQYASATGSLSGPLASPVIDATVAAQNVRLVAKGKEPLVYPDVRARGRVLLVPTPKIVNGEVTLTEADGRGAVTATADAVSFGKSGIDLRGGRVTGLGAPIEADVKVRGRDVHIRAKGEHLDIDRAAKLTGIAQLRLLPKTSRADIDVDFETSAEGAHGYANIAVVGGPDHPGSSAEIHARADGRHITASGRAELAEVGWIEVIDAELDLPGRPSAETFARATGTIDVRAEADLSRALEQLPLEGIASMTGRVTASLHAERFSDKALPWLRGTLKTQGLEVVLAGEKSADGKEETPSTTISGVDGSIHVEYDGQTDDTEVAIATWDEHGLLANAGAKAKVPLIAWLEGKTKLDKTNLATLDFGATAWLPKRALSKLPKIIPWPSQLDGQAELTADFIGSLAKPHAVVRLSANRIRETTTSRENPRYRPLDTEAIVQWNEESLVANVAVDEKQGQAATPQRATIEGAVDDNVGGGRRQRVAGAIRSLFVGQASLLDVLAHGTKARWDGRAEIDVQNMDLAPLPIPGQITGALSGRITLRDLNTNPALGAKMTVTNLGVARATVETGDLSVGARNGVVVASLRVRNKDKGSANVNLTSRALRWKGLDVDWDEAEDTRVDYAVRNMRLALIQPIIQRAVPEIDGRVDGRGSASFNTKAQQFEGGLSITQGRVYLNVLGEEITEISAKARFERSGTFHVDDITGIVGDGSVKAKFTGRLRGLHFLGADGTVSIPSKDGVPLSSEGATFAEVTGEVRVAMQMAEDNRSLAMMLDIPRAVAELPTRDTQSLQSLDPDPNITTGIRLADGVFEETNVRGRKPRAAREEKTAEAPFTTRITVNIGEDVKLQGRGMDVSLRGTTLVELARELSITGRVDLKGGSIEVHGRRFVIDRGTVTFPEGGEPNNPTIVAAAYWDAPDRTRVWVEFTGPLKGGKLVLRSEPPYSQNEILSILLFGRPDPNASPSSGTAQGSSGGAVGGAASVGGGFVATDLNRALGEIDENINVETDTLSGNRARAKVGYRIYRDLRISGGYAPGQTYREPDTTYLFLDWQFLPRWSLVGTYGNRGTSILDVLYQYRY